VGDGGLEPSTYRV